MEKGKEYLKGANKTTAKSTKGQKGLYTEAAVLPTSAGATYKYKYQKYKYNDGEGAHCSSALNFSRDKIVFCSAQDERMPKIFFKKTLEKFDKIRSRI